jgi:hypothetical protein
VIPMCEYTLADAERCANHTLPSTPTRHMLAQDRPGTEE